MLALMPIKPLILASPLCGQKHRKEAETQTHTGIWMVRWTDRQLVKWLDRRTPSQAVCGQANSHINVQPCNHVAVVHDDDDGEGLKEGRLRNFS